MLPQEHIKGPGHSAKRWQKFCLFFGSKRKRLENLVEVISRQSVVLHLLLSTLFIFHVFYDLVAVLIWFNVLNVSKHP